MHKIVIKTERKNKTNTSTDKQAPRESLLSPRRAVPPPIFLKMRIICDFNASGVEKWRVKSFQVQLLYGNLASYFEIVGLLRLTSI